MEEGVKNNQNPVNVLTLWMPPRAKISFLEVESFAYEGKYRAASRDFLGAV